MERTLDHLTVLIDGLALLKARAGLEEEIGRPIDLDFRRLFYEASWGIFEPERSNSKRVVRAEFFARGLFEPDDAYDRPSLRRSDFFAHGLMEEHELFYDQLQQIGYRIHGDPRLEGFTPWAPPTDEIVDLLRNEVGPHSGNLLYVGYEGDESDIRDALLDVARQVDGSRIALGQFQVDDSQRYEDLGGGILVPKLDIASDLGMSRGSHGKILRLPEAPHHLEPPDDVPEHDSKDDRDAGPLPHAARPLLILVNHSAIEGALWSILDGRPGPEYQPDWGLVRNFCVQLAASADVRALSFFANRPPKGVLDNLTHLGFEPKPLGSATQREQPRGLAAQAIDRALKGLRDRDLDVVLVTTTGKHAKQLRALQEIDADKAPANRRRLTVIGLWDRMPVKVYLDAGIEVLDLERDVGAFGQPLPKRWLPTKVDNLAIDEVLGDFGLNSPDGPDAA